MMVRLESLHGCLVPLDPGLGFLAHWVEHFAAVEAAAVAAVAAAEVAAVPAAVAAAVAALVPLTPSEQSMPVPRRPNPLGLREAGRITQDAHTKLNWNYLKHAAAQKS